MAFTLSTTIRLFAVNPVPVKLPPMVRFFAQNGFAPLAKFVSMTGDIDTGLGIIRALGRTLPKTFAPYWELLPSMQESVFSSIGEPIVSLPARWSVTHELGRARGAGGEVHTVLSQRLRMPPVVLAAAYAVAITLVSFVEPLQAAPNAASS